MSNITKFFSKLKAEVKFSTVGEGHRLNESAPTPRNVQPSAPPQTHTRLSSASGPAVRAAAEAAEQSGFQVLKEKFIEGDWMFMSFVLVCLILVSGEHEYLSIPMGIIQLLIRVRGTGISHECRTNFPFICIQKTRIKIETNCWFSHFSFYYA